MAKLKLRTYEISQRAPESSLDPCSNCYTDGSSSTDKGDAMKLMTRYLNAKIYINDLDGNAIGIVVLASEVLRISGVTNDEVEIFQQEALSGSYENVLSTTVNWVDTSRKRGQPCVNPALARQFKSAVDKVVLLQNSTSASIIPELVR